jgi:para-aminobenzoate synthetase component 1
MLLTRAEAIERFDELGRSRIPFFFFTDFKGERAYVILADETTDILFDVRGKRNYDLSAIHQPVQHFSFDRQPEPKSRFKEKFDYVVDQIRYGNSFLVNLTVRTPVTCSYSLSDIFAVSKAKYKALFPGRFTFFSPETFIEIKDNCIYSHPMKGTIDASVPDAEQVILNDPKETAEHVTIVDLIRNDLSQVAQQVDVTRFRYIDTITTHEKELLQVSSEIRGQLPAGWQHQLGQMLFSLLPAGSISGAPKDQTVRIIETAEDYARDFYTGICGYFDGESLDTGVMIRFIEEEDNKLVFKSGGGITSFSKLDLEYQEVIDKIYIPL